MAHGSQLNPLFYHYNGHKVFYWICFLHLESFKDLFCVDVLAHKNPILMLLYLHSQKTAECAHCNLEVMTQLINKHIDLTFVTLCDQAVIYIDDI
jgi:hypothetical protein